MGNVLIDRLPTTVEVDGRLYDIDSDFRTCLRIILAFEDAELTSVRKTGGDAGKSLSRDA